MKPVIDSREPSKVKRFFEQNSDTEWAVRELPQADFYLPQKDVAIERKEASDFVSSTTEGRLSEQADRMAANHDHNYIIIENDVNTYFDGDNYRIKTLFDQRYSHVNYRSLVGMETSLAVKRDMKIIYTEGVEHTRYAVDRIFERHLDGEAGQGSQHVAMHDTGEVDDTQVAMLMQVDGISQGKAEKIVNHDRFNSLTSLAADDVTDWLQDIDGIGEVLAERVVTPFL